MAIAEDVTKQLIKNSDSAVAAVDLTDFKNCVVVYSGGTPGKPQITSPAGQGVDWAGVLRPNEDTASGEVGEFVTRGTVKIKANAAFNSGIKLAISGVDGKVAAAAAGDYVVGISREAATGADHLVSVELVAPGQQLN